MLERKDVREFFETQMKEPMFYRNTFSYRELVGEWIKFASNTGRKDLELNHDYMNNPEVEDCITLIESIMVYLREGFTDSVVSRYNAEDGTHCIVFNMNLIDRQKWQEFLDEIYKEDNQEK